MTKKLASGTTSPEVTQMAGISRFRVNHGKNPRVKLGGFEATRAHQSFKEECDINRIMKRFETTGVLPEMIKTNPRYGDFSNVPDFQQSMDIVNKAVEQFESLSSRVRRRFNNDPQEFLAFATDPSNMEEMVQLGLATRRKPEAPDNAVPEGKAPRQSEAPKEPSGPPKEAGDKVPPK